jgi:AhpD family alkylhydroperoxidase
MPARLRYPDLAPAGYAALSAFGHYINTGTALEPSLLGLVNLRASILNGCDFCIGLHTAELRHHHEPQSRIDAVGQAPQSDAFTLREQAALRWTEVITRLDGSHASDTDFAAITQFFQGKDLVDLTFAIANINAWNRMGVAFRPPWHEHAGKRAPAFPAAASAPPPGQTDEVSAVADDGGKVNQD